MHEPKPIAAWIHRLLAHQATSKKARSQGQPFPKSYFARQVILGQLAYENKTKPALIMTTLPCSIHQYCERWKRRTI